MRYVLDTNAVSALMRGEAKAIDRLQATPRDQVGIPQPVIAEIVYGIERLPRSRRREALAQRFELIRVEIGRLSWTDAVSETFGAIKATLERRGTPVEDFDVAVAAHALAEGATLVTANVAHMVRIPALMLEDWTR